MTNRKPSWPLWCAGVILLPVLYVLSLGPLLWLKRNDYMPEWTDGPAFAYFVPLVYSFEVGPHWWFSLIEAYLKLWGITLDY